MMVWKETLKKFLKELTNNTYHIYYKSFCKLIHFLYKSIFSHWVGFKQSNIVCKPRH